MNHSLLLMNEKSIPRKGKLPISHSVKKSEQQKVPIHFQTLILLSRILSKAQKNKFPTTDWFSANNAKEPELIRSAMNKYVTHVMAPELIQMMMMNRVQLAKV